MNLEIRRPNEKDAQELIDFMIETYTNSQYLANEPDEFKARMTIEKEIEFINGLDHIHRTMLLATIDGKIVGDVSVGPVSPRRKMSHRAQMGISVSKDYQHQGIGTRLVKEAICFAKAAGYEQLELEVCSENTNAIGLYLKCGFQKCGCLPYGFKLNENKYLDLDEMVLFL